MTLVWHGSFYDMGTEKKANGGRKEFGEGEREREDQGERNRTKAKMLSTRRWDLSVGNQSLELRVGNRRRR